MRYYIGIDLGTTNSSISSYDGTTLKIWKSPEQNDVTPSVIYIDRRGNRFTGQRAYDAASHSPGNAAWLFKRLMGTDTPVVLPAMNITMTPEECSAEIIKVLFSYLPEEIRNDPQTATVVTVPAAFNQMQKEATRQAAEMAGLGLVALMQEPVAAVMSAMRRGRRDGIFAIYDLGGGTLDVALAESLGGRVSLLSHGGIAVCGGRDFDRAVIEHVVTPWLANTFKLPENLATNPDYATLMRLSAWAVERAKIELSGKEEVMVGLSEAEIRQNDQDGNEIYLEIPLSRHDLNRLIEKRVDDSITAVREAVAKAGLQMSDLSGLVFIGGPTQYKPLRDKVSSELGLMCDQEMNPMTAVAEGAGLYAESIDWGSQNRGRKSSKGQLAPGGLDDFKINYIARTPESRSKIMFICGSIPPGAEYQVDSLDTGWTSGRRLLTAASAQEVSLSQGGDNAFKVFVFDGQGQPLPLKEDLIVITKTASTVEGIPSSHSIGMEVLETLDGHPVLDYLVRSGEALPKKGKRKFKAASSLRSGTDQSLNFKLWEGEIEDPVSDNRPIGVLKITGHDFADGFIPAGADLKVDFEILDSGNITVEVSVPCIGGTFNSDRNFYSRQEGQRDYSQAAGLVVSEAWDVINRIDSINGSLHDRRLNQAKNKLNYAVKLDPETADQESVQEAQEKVLEARRILATVRRERLREIRQIELDDVMGYYEERARQHAKPSEVSAIENLARAAQRSIDLGDADFEHCRIGINRKINGIMWRQDWHVEGHFNWLAGSPYKFTDQDRFKTLVAQGRDSVASGDISRLRGIINELYEIKIDDGPASEFAETANILRG